jgi:hypothetical protein
VEYGAVTKQFFATKIYRVAQNGESNFILRSLRLERATRVSKQKEGEASYGKVRSQIEESHNSLT